MGTDGPRGYTSAITCSGAAGHRTAMRGRYPMSVRDERKAADTPAPAAGRGLADLLAFLGVLALTVALVLLVDRTGQLSVRLVFAGAAGLVVACVNTWRRLRRAELRRWKASRAPAIEPTTTTSAMPTGTSAPGCKPQSPA
jgi:hypothetical protein